MKNVQTYCMLWWKCDFVLLLTVSKIMVTSERNIIWCLLEHHILHLLRIKDKIPLQRSSRVTR